jgi:hypothetical protein
LPASWTLGLKVLQFEGNKCFNCGKYSHRGKDCQVKKKGKDKYEGKKKEKANEKGDDKRTDDQSNIVNEHITTTNEAIEEEMHNFESYDVTSTKNDECMIFYDWLTDSATSSHVFAQREAFIMYTALLNSTATRVGDKEAKITSHGTVELSKSNESKYILCLENVLHIPEQKSNLISLGVAVILVEAEK